MPMKPKNLYGSSNYTLDSTSGYGADNRRSRRLKRRARGREGVQEVVTQLAPDPSDLRVPLYEAMHDEDDHTWGYIGREWHNDLRPLASPLVRGIGGEAS